MPTRIASVKAREILDSRGNPTVEVQVRLRGGATGVAGVPSGASTGAHEAHELRDGERDRYHGLGVRQAVEHVNGELGRSLAGVDALHQQEIDEEMVRLDGQPDKSRLGANAILGVSLAVAAAAADSQRLPLYRYLRQLYRLELKEWKLPVPLVNVINGGRHADSNLDLQEFWIIPKGIAGFAEQVRAAAEVFHELATVLRQGGYDTDVGNEGGYAPDLPRTEIAFESLLAAIQAAGYRASEQIALGLDAGASTFLHVPTQRYLLNLDKRSLSSAELIQRYQEWSGRFPIIALEDGLAEDDWNGWQALTRQLGSKLTLIGDDLFVTNRSRLQQGIDQGVANAVLVKPNQVGTLSETMAAIQLARQHGYRIAVSHRSGETVDTFIADLAVAVNAELIKTGSMCRGERIAKYNRLLEIADEIGG